jgi:hypothetical protein
MPKTAVKTPLVELPYAMGLIHDLSAPQAVSLGAAAEQPIPAPPASVAAPNTEWPMVLNDEIGDCTLAGEIHVEQAGALIVDEPWEYPGDSVVETEYFDLTGGADTGLLLTQVLQPWHTTGLFGAKNGGFASVHPYDTTLLKQAIWIFGNLYIGVNLPAIAQQQFKPDGSGVWELTNTPADYDIAGGHCVVPVAYSIDGVRAVTWGGTVLITWAWWFMYVSQVYTVVPSRFVEKGGDSRGFNLATINHYLPRV